MISNLSKTLDSNHSAGFNITHLELLPAWHKPAITRIELKRTLNASGSGDDGQSLSGFIDGLAADK